MEVLKPFIILIPIIFILILQYPTLGIYLMTFFIPLSPLIIVGETEKREITIRFDDIVFVAVFISWIIRGFPTKKYGDGFYIMKLLIAMSLWYVTTTTINLPNLNIKTSIFFLAKYLQYFSFYFLSYSLLDEKSAKNVIKVYFFAVSIATVFWILKYILPGYTGESVHFPFHKKYGGRENVGIFALGAMSLILSHFFFEKNIWKRIFSIIFLSALSLVYIRTISRASYLAGFIWAIFMLTMTRRRDIILTILLISVVFPFIAPDYFYERIKYTFEGEGGREILGFIYVESSASARIIYWKALFTDVFPHKPLNLLIGFGVAGSGLVDSQYIRLIAESGIIGFTIFIYTLIKIFKAFFSTYRESEDKFLKWFSLGMAGWLAGITAHMLPANTFTLMQQSYAFWLLSGTLLATKNLATKNKEESKSGG